MSKVQTFSLQGKSRGIGPRSSLKGDSVTLTPYKSNGGHNYRTLDLGHITQPCQDAPDHNFNQLVRECLAVFNAISSIRQDFGGITRYCINVDWFEATLEGSWLPIGSMGEPEKVISLLNGDLILERDPMRWNGTKHYQFCYQVFLYGEPVATIITHPRNAIMGRKSAGEGTRQLSQLRLENHVLYRAEWLQVYRDILEGLGVVLNNITRLDISVDGGPFLEQYRAIISGKYKKVGRAKHACHLDANDQIEGFYIGSRSSERYIRGYSKTSEIKQAGGHKTYITAAWTKSNLEAWNKGAGEVARLELVLKAKAIAQLSEFDVDRLGTDSYLAGIMRASLSKFYQFVDAEELLETGNITRCARIEAIDWAYFDAHQLERLPTTKKPNVIWAVQRRITFDMLEYWAKVEGNGEELFNQSFAFNYELAKSYGILDWFERKTPYWRQQKDFHELMVQERRRARYRHNGVYFTQNASV